MRIYYENINDICTIVTDVPLVNATLKILLLTTNSDLRYSEI